MKRFLLLIFLSGFMQGVHARQLDSLTSRLHHYTVTRSEEKLYLHFDKPFYSIGDTIWFKVYLIDAATGALSSRSKVAYMDLQQPGSALRQVVIPLQMGMGAGQLVLNDSLYHAGIYSLRAYTQWMRNGVSDYFFHRSLTVGNALRGLAKGQAGFNNIATEAETALQNRIVNSQNVTSLTLDFFPEGGWLVNGLRSKVAFKALNGSGRGIKVKGYIIDENGRKIALFESGHGGMGTFSFLPEAGRKYSAVVSEGVYQNHQKALPEAKSSGYILSVNPSGNDSLRVRINRTSGAASTIHLLVQAHGRVQQAISLPMNGNAITFILKKVQFAEGINQLTLFSSTFEPLCERLFFVYRNAVQSYMTSDKEIYATRQKVTMDLSVKDRQGVGVVGGYSVAVVLDDKVNIKEEDQQSIYASLLLSSDLRGTIESPNYYFTDYDERKAMALDALLLTQGWRRFSWQEIKEEFPTKPKFEAEEGLSVSGRVTNRNGKGIDGAKVSLLAAKQYLFLDTLTDKNGNFNFRNIDLEDSVVVIVRARGLTDKGGVRMEITPSIPMEKMEFKTDLAGSEVSTETDTVLQTYLIRTAGLFEQMEKRRRSIQGTTLKEVEVVTKRKIPEIKGSVYPFAAPPPNHTFGPDQLQEMVNLETYLRGLMGITVGKENKILGRYPPFNNKSVDMDGRVYNVGRPIGPMVILLNGMAIPDLSGINPKALTGVQIINGGMEAMNMASSLFLPNDRLNEFGQFVGYGIVFLTMTELPAKYIKAKRPDGFVQFSMNGYSYAREFYAPRYDTQKESATTDYRSTLFWKPDLITGEDGKTIFDFYTSDESGRYRVTLEGVGTNGELTRIISYFVVK
ncbi:hypothetical protein D9M68_439860 [compost metagenome]